MDREVMIMTIYSQGDKPMREMTDEEGIKLCEIVQDYLESLMPEAEVFDVCFDDAKRLTKNLYKRVS
jgi:hypothetical protein